MSRYVNMLADGMEKRGHKVDVWKPKKKFFNLPAPGFLKKWLGYIDQFIIFPYHIRRRLKACTPNTLFVFTDQALGPWVPLVKKLPHVIHCHDFLAYRSASGEFPENQTGLTGRIYQNHIRNGYSNGRYFICVSQRTKEDLEHFHLTKPIQTTIVYNGLNKVFAPHDVRHARSVLQQLVKRNLTTGYLLHIGGNVWYKNRCGVIEIYNAWRSFSQINLPLIMIGEPPSADLKKLHKQSEFKSEIHILTDINDDTLRYAYAGANAFLFPSYAEGFGWPIAEAMAAGCPVITTNEAPMTEVAGDAGFFIPRKPIDHKDSKAWAHHAAKVVEQVIYLSFNEQNNLREACLANAKRFDNEKVMNEIEEFYNYIISYQNDSKKIFAHVRHSWTNKV